MPHKVRRTWYFWLTSAALSYAAANRAGGPGSVGCRGRTRMRLRQTCRDTTCSLDDLVFLVEVFGLRSQRYERSSSVFGGFDFEFCTLWTAPCTIVFNFADIWCSCRILLAHQGILPIRSLSYSDYYLIEFRQFFSCRYSFFPSCSGYFTDLH